MVSEPPLETNENITYILVTGPNSGVGFCICERLVNDFLSTRPDTQSLHLIIPTRSTKKSSETINALRKVADNHSTIKNALPNSSSQRITFQAESLELTNLLSVRALTRRLVNSSLPRIDAIILNAGIGGWWGIDWPQAVWTVLTDLVHSVSFPKFYRSAVGSITPPQFPPIPSATNAIRQAPALGNVFTANVFGHYVLVHGLMSLLRPSISSSLPPSRIIWLSSIDSSPNFTLSDLQGLQTSIPYAYSKRITDLLTLTAHLHSSRPSVSKYLTPDATGRSAVPKTVEPIILNTHPGISVTSIIWIPPPLIFFWTLALLLARLFGSTFHVVYAYPASFAPAYLALAPHSTITHLSSPSGPSGGGVGKWGSCTSRWLGKEGMRRTFVAGYGGGGIPPPPSPGPEWDEWGFGPRDGPNGTYRWGTGRRRDAKKPTREDIEDFELAGAEVWREMEALRKEWTERCEEYETLNGQGDMKGVKEKDEGRMHGKANGHHESV